MSGRPAQTSFSTHFHHPLAILITNSYLHKVIYFLNILDTKEMNNTSSEKMLSFFIPKICRYYKVELKSVSTVFIY
jgi:hypothetical protein